MKGKKATYKGKIMLDIKYVVEHIDDVIDQLQNRNQTFEHIRVLVDMHQKRKDIIAEVEAKKAFKNETSKKIGEYKRNKLDTKELMDSIASLGGEIESLDRILLDIETRIENLLLNIPNIPHASTPVGTSEEDNVVVKTYLEPTTFSFTPKDHVELSEQLQILDFERATKITGARFVVDKGLGARLERALLQFMMDTHAFEHGYTEMMLPYIVNEKSMIATGQFPKFKEEAFQVKMEDKSWFLNPTAEVPSINYYRDEIIQEALPVKFVSYTTAFRAEAGSAGKDTRGILRQHQFHKVELIQFTSPESSYDALEQMLLHSETILQKLKLPYRVVSLCTGDLGFSMAKTYDIEVWLPGQNTYREIGSISNAEDYQARRGNIRFKRDKEAKAEYVHTLNGSGLAIGRTMIAIIENYQNEDGTITVPEVLIPYMRVTQIG
jgi:seryl-tRNA synthetase